MKLLVANNAAPFVRGGAEMLAERLVDELRTAGHEAELMRIPLGNSPESVRDAVVAASTIELMNVDRVIGMKFPAYLVPHDDIVIWLVHQFRQVYDLGPDNGGWPDPELQRLVRSADDAAFTRARRIYTISPVVADRLRTYSGFEAEVLPHPPHADEAYRCEPAEPYIVALGRISDGKRQWLAARAMQHVRAPIRLVIAGAPDDDATLVRLEAAVAEAGVGDRVEIVPRYISSEEKLDLLARCAVSVSLPVDEDSYSYVQYEAAMSAKPLVTASDSGGARTLVVEDETGHVVAPEPSAIAAAIDGLLADRDRAAAMGRAARAHAEGLGLSWQRVVEELTR